MTRRPYHNSRESPTTARRHRSKRASGDRRDARTNVAVGWSVVDRRHRRRRRHPRRRRSFGAAGPRGRGATVRRYSGAAVPRCGDAAMPRSCGAGVRRGGSGRVAGCRNLRQSGRGPCEPRGRDLRPSWGSPSLGWPRPSLVWLAALAACSCAFAAGLRRRSLERPPGARFTICALIPSDSRPLLTGGVRPNPAQPMKVRPGRSPSARRPARKRVRWGYTPRAAL